MSIKVIVQKVDSCFSDAHMRHVAVLNFSSQNTALSISLFVVSRDLVENFFFQLTVAEFALLTSLIRMTKTMEEAVGIQWAGGRGDWL